MQCKDAWDAQVLNFTNIHSDLGLRTLVLDFKFPSEIRIIQSL